MKKILFITNMYPSKRFPHYGTFIEKTYSLVKEENEVIIIKMSKCNNKFLKLFKYLFFYLRIILLGIFAKYDFIYAHYASHLAIPLLIVKKIKKNTKILMNVHGNDVVPEEEKDYKFIKYVRKILFKSDKIISPSKYFKEVLIKEYNINEEKIKVYPSSGVDSKTFYKKDRKNALEELNLAPEYKYIGYVSRIEKNKGWDTFVEAIHALDEKIDKNIKFIIAGSGKEEKQLQEKISDYNIKDRIIKFSYMNQEQLCNIYNILECFCFTTYRKSESLGLVGLEAMQCGCIVVASNAGGPATYISNKNGLLFKPMDYKELAINIEKVLSLSENEKSIISYEARKTANEYESKKIGKVLMSIINEM